MDKPKIDSPKLIPTKISLEKVAKGFEKAKAKSDKDKRKASSVDFIEIK